MKNIYIIGNGSREQVIKEKIITSNPESKVIISPLLPPTNENIDMVIIGNEAPIVNGYADVCPYKCFAPSREAARIEGCKIFAKNFMTDNNIATSDYRIFHSKLDAFNFIEHNFTATNKYVIKNPALASGKGVHVPENKEEAILAINQLESGFILIEERVYGTEVSVMAFCNGQTVSLMPPAMDYKRIYDQDQGPNTGGMGAIAPVNILTEEDLENIKEDMTKVVQALNFKGVLYAGLMKTKYGYSVLEFNCRLGDPETQVVLNLLESNLLEIMDQCIKELPLNIKWKDSKAACVVLSHVDYPYRKLKEEVSVIIEPSLNIKLYPGSLYSNCTNGGRVASLVQVGDDLSHCLETIYNQINKINYPGMYYRRDIGLNYITRSDNRKLKIAILGSTKGTSIIELLEKKEQLNVSIEIIIASSNSEILEKGKKYNLPTLCLPYRKDKDYYHKLANILMVHDVDIILTVGWMHIFPADFCHQFKGQLYNIHPSLLPAHKGLCGMKVHQAVLARGDQFTGCTIHEITPQVDSGKIKLQKQCLVDTDEAIKLKDKVQRLESQALIEFIKIQQNKPINYKASGVDIEDGNNFVETIKDENIGDFCGFFTIQDHKIGVCCDGVGTKLEIANQYNKLENIGIDLVAMCVNDLMVRGFRPRAFLDYIAQEKLDQNKLATIVASIKEGCKLAGCHLLGGETAEMPGIYFHKGFDLAGFSVGILENQLYPKVSEIKKGCAIYGLKSNGIHSNGYSLVRKLLKSYNYDIDTLLKPTKIYTECLDIISEYGDDLLAMAHITGGGLIDNIERVIPKDCNISLDITIENEFQWIMEKGKLTKNEMLRTFNCGYGMALIFKPHVRSTKFDQIGIIL